MRVNSPLPMSKVRIMETKDAYISVLENAGANLPTRDAVDKRVIEQVKTGKISYVDGGKTALGKSYVKRRLPEDSYKKGIISDIAQVGGYPEYKGVPYIDTDHDGIPDVWEVKNGLNPKVADSQKVAKSGYSNIEVYLNSLVPIINVKP